MARGPQVRDEAAGALAIEPAAVSPAALARSEVVVASTAALVIAGALAAFGPPGGDAPAHLYRILLGREGTVVWDNLWYAGQYPFSSYSLLYYLPAALVGNLPVTLAGVVASAALFASIAEREWGADARWASRAFAVAVCASVFTGTYSYAVALATALAALWALQRRRIWLAILAAALTVGFSPLAFVFLVLALAAVAVVRRKLDRPTVLVAAGVAAAAVVQLLVVSLFHDSSVYPFRFGELLAVCVASALGAALALRSPRGRALAAFLILWALAAAVFYLVPSPVGENVSRLRGLAFPLVLLAATLSRFRPRLLAVTALGAALAYTLLPYLVVIPYRTDGRPAEAAFWQPAIDAMRAGSGNDFRVEVVPTSDHWDAYYVPKAGLPIARGWYRQIDVKANALFYRGGLTADVYRRWLRRLGIRYVLLPDTNLDRRSALAEAALLRSGSSGLRLVGRTVTGALYELPGATPLLSGPGRARLTEFGHRDIRGTISAPGVYRLAVRHMPYWRVAPAGICLSRAPDGMTLLHARRGGSFSLTVDQDPLALAKRLVDRDETSCTDG